MVIEAAKKAGEDVSQMDLDKDMTEEERAKEEKKKNASVEHAEGYFEATDPTIPPVPELKLRYYHLMIRFYSHSNEYLEICRCYQNIMECEGVKEDPSKWTPVMKKVVWYVALAARQTACCRVLWARRGGGAGAAEGANVVPLHRLLVQAVPGVCAHAPRACSGTRRRSASLLMAHFSFAIFSLCLARGPARTGQGDRGVGDVVPRARSQFRPLCRHRQQVQCRMFVWCVPS